MAVNFDPNLNLSGRTSKKTIKLVFGLWEYRATFMREIGGNISGLAAIKFVTEGLSDELWDLGMVLKSGDGGELLCRNGKDDDWLCDMLISAEIINIEPLKKDIQ